MKIKKKIKKIEIKIFHVVHYIFLPVILVGSDILIGIYGHFAGSTEEISSESLMQYLSTPEQLQELFIVIVMAIVIVVAVEWIVQKRIKHNKR